MRLTVALAILAAALLQGCNSPGDDPKNIDKAPPTAPGAQGLPPVAGKNLPTMGGPSNMGGGAPSGAGAGTHPAEAPKAGS